MTDWTRLAEEYGETRADHERGARPYRTAIATSRGTSFDHSSHRTFRGALEEHAANARWCAKKGGFNAGYAARIWNDQTCDYDTSGLTDEEREAVEAVEASAAARASAA